MPPLFAFPSLHEGFGFPVLEALAAGTPVFCSDRGSLKEVAGPSLIIESTEAESIADGIADAMGSPSELDRVRNNGLGWAQGFLRQESINSHAALYERALKTQRF
ncbi:hypothetical protein StoSoilB3_42190 (plasmid) [Arthrobacter sp. StoSoilB3]|nr:hypothetical protein StoSoilB3_42190 [Arthrobacter sp. StoSoilB3]